ncbi:MAG: Gfo/Idh/MocA family oxidoreductase [Ruminococcaceae bacterium]|nr:Gfo/Idh/MocA family oxidoreductase [Oscillospiraceae bacterium]
MKDSKKAVIGIIGCGHIAKDVHLENAFTNPRIRVKWCSDLMQENLDYVKEHYVGEKFTQNYMDVLEDEEVDGVLILTCHDVRERIIRDAAEHGKHIFVEKPMSTTVKESYDIMRIIQQNNVKLVVGFNRRCAPIVKDAKALLDSQDTAEETPWRYKRYGDVTKLREEEATMMLIRINDDSASFKSYAFDEFVGQGTIIGEFCHFFDLACYMIGKEPIKIYAEGWSRVNASVTVLFEDLSVCTIFDASCGSFDHPKELIEVYKGGMSLQLDHYLQLRVGGRTDINKKNYPFKIDPYPEITEGEGSNLYINKVRERNKNVGKSTDFGFPTVDKGHYNLLDGFVDCILLDAPSPCDAVAGSRATLMCLKARESVRLGLPVKISIDEYDFVISR